MDSFQEYALKAKRLLNKREAFYLVAATSAILTYGKGSWSDPFEVVNCGIYGVLLGFLIDIIIPSEYMYFPTIAMIGSILYSRWNG
jgi:hypothetical protein